MKIPPLKERDEFYDLLAQDCLVSRNDRIANYERLRCYYLFGCDATNNPAYFNKIFPAIDQKVSFMFSAETTRFGIILGEDFKNNKNELAKVIPLTRRLNGKWSDSNCDVQFRQALTWSMVYNSMFVKLVQRGRMTVPYLVEPHCMGVLREDMPFLDDQEAFVHTYYISHKNLDRMLDGHPRKAQIIAGVTASMRQTDHDLPAGVQRIVMSTQPMSGYPNGPGQIASPYALTDAYRARNADETVEMRELWAWDDDLNDYRIVTMASGRIYIYDRENFYLPGEHAFTQVCPNPSYDYFWGQSEVDRVTQLQDLLELRQEQVIELLNRQVKPPSAQRGNWQGIMDETNYAAQVFGATLTSTDPTAEIKTFSPTIPQDVYAEHREIYDMFNEVMGLSNVAQGKGEAGVRSKGHAAELARLGSSRIKSAAFTIEDSLDRIGTQYLKLMQQHDPTIMRFKDENGAQRDFIAEQFTKDYTVRVDGHSSSPIFMEDIKAEARELFEAKAIDRRSLIEMVDPPGKQLLLANLEKIEAAEAKAHQEQVAAEQAGAGQKGVRAVK